MTASRPYGLVVWLFWAMTFPAAGWGDDQSSVATIDSLLQDTYPADEPGAAVIIVKDGETLFRHAYGMANLEHGIRLSPEMVFRLGSITKQFTATAIMLLQQQGKLSVHDPITKYLPDYPVHGHEITIEHLLTHTSGIFSYTSIPGYMENPVRRDLSTEELIAVFSNKPMTFAPGDAWQYNNSGYVLAGAIIEKVAGVGYADFVQQSIFDPLQMKSSHYGGQQLIRNRVSGYAGKPGSYKNADFLSMTQPHAAGSLLSNVDDLALWDASLGNHDLLTDNSFERMTTPYRLNGGESTDYGYGFRLDKLRSWDMVQHGGGIHGFATFAMRVPEETLYVAVLTNNPEKRPSPATVAMRIAAIALGDPFAEREAIEVSDDVLNRYVGTYGTEDRNRRVVTVEDGYLYMQRPGGTKVQALAASNTTFFRKDSLTYFEMVLDDAGNVTGIKVHPNGAEPGQLVPRIDVDAS